jgi:gluconolactonase
MKSLLLLSLLLTLVACNQPTQQTNSDQKLSTIGKLEKVDSAFDAIVPPSAKIEVIGEGYDWSEGPLWLPSEQIVIWSDVPKNTIYSWKEGEEAREYLKPSGYTGEGVREGSNGLLLNPKGELVLCQHGDRRIAKMTTPLNAPGAKFETFADRFDGKRLNSPNDAAYDAQGNLYFTDPPYGLPGIMQSTEKELPFQGVFRLSVNGELTLLVNNLTYPNGIAFSPDFKKCYVAVSDSEMAIWMVYDVTPEGNFINGKVFFDATAMVPGNKGLPDGLKVRSDGTVFATGPGGVLVFSAAGKHLGTIVTGEATANCAFNEDESVLFMTADQFMTRIRLR